MVPQKSGINLVFFLYCIFNQLRTYIYFPFLLFINLDTYIFILYTYIFILYTYIFILYTYIFILYTYIFILYTYIFTLEQSHIWLAAVSPGGGWSHSQGQQSP